MMRMIGLIRGHELGELGRVLSPPQRRSSRAAGYDRFGTVPAVVV